MDLRPLLFRMAVAMLSLGILSAASKAASDSATMLFVPASDSSFVFSGRMDFSDPASPVVIWEASTIAVDFEGGSVAACFKRATGPVFFDATVDGASTVLALHGGHADASMPIPVRGAGLHHLVFFKRSEAAAGYVHFQGIEIAPGARVFTPAPEPHAMKMLVFGDSITAGACDEDGAKDQWDDRSTHDAAYSWAALTAAAFSADYQNISVSGIGLAAGYDDILMGQVWDHLYPLVSSPKADFRQFEPDVVLVLLGDNDASYPKDNHLPFPANFGENYIALIRAIRGACPKASIVLLNGGMEAGATSPDLSAAWGAAVAGLEAKDPAIHHFTFKHWTRNHPRIADHKALADELIGWLRPQAFMKMAQPSP